MVYFFEDQFCPFEHVMVPEADDVNAEIVEGLGAGSVVLFLLGFEVTTAVDFDGEAEGFTVEIEDEAVNGVLAAEFETVQPAVAQVTPQGLLRKGGFVPQFAGTFDKFSGWSVVCHD